MVPNIHINLTIPSKARTDIADIDLGLFQTEAALQSFRFFFPDSDFHLKGGYGSALCLFP